MTTYYLDTSALTKKYVEEAGTEALSSLLEEAEGLLTSGLTELELLATMERLKRAHRLDSPSYRRALAEWERDLHAGSVSLLEISQEILKIAKRVLRQHDLKAPDAIQLASALITNRSVGGEVGFLCADRHLLQAARLEGLKCLDLPDKED